MDYIDENGRTLIHGITSKYLLQLLIEAGVDIWAVDDSGKSPLYESLFMERYDENEERYYHDIRSFQVLIDSGMDFNHQDENGRTILHLVGQYNEDLLGCPMDCIETMLKRGANPDILDKSGETAIQTHIQNEHPLELINLLTEYSKKTHKKDIPKYKTTGACSRSRPSNFL